MSWKPENAKEITERYKEWTPPEGITYILPPHTMMGRNQSVTVSEVDDPMVLAKIDRAWRDIVTMESCPVMESAEIMKVKP
jgi:hypothetical protein